MIEVFCAISIETLIILITITVLNLNIILKNNLIILFRITINCYLDTLDLEFKIIALSETGINNHHAVYNITHYNLEMDHYAQEKRWWCEPLYPQYYSIQDPKRSGYRRCR